MAPSLRRMEIIRIDTQMTDNSEADISNFITLDEDSIAEKLQDLVTNQTNRKLKISGYIMMFNLTC